MLSHPDYPHFGSRDDLESLQLQKLKAALAYAHANTACYRSKCDEAGIRPADFRTLADLRHFPFTRKTDFRNADALFAVPRESLARLHASSGTTGKPTIVGYTKRDLDLWAGLCARCILVAGGRPGDTVHNAYGYGLFTGGLGVHAGAERLGCVVIPASGGQTERQAQLICDLKPRVICCTPSYMLVIAEALERMGTDPRDTALEIGILGAEPWSGELRREIEHRFNIAALDIYGLSEVIGPGVAQERIEARGALTVWEDAFFPEIVDPVTGEPVPEGAFGELVLTSLSKEAMPVIRYRTGDLTRLSAPAGDIPMRRMDPITGRSDDMLIIRGVNVFPRQIEELILSESALSPHYRIDVRRLGARDEIAITVEAAGPCDEEAMVRAGHTLVHRMKSHYGITADVRVVSRETLPRSEGKARRVFDHRRDATK